MCLRNKIVILEESELKQVKISKTILAIPWNCFLAPSSSKRMSVRISIPMDLMELLILWNIKSTDDSEK
jgi:hypothetical protein